MDVWKCPTGKCALFGLAHSFLCKPHTQDVAGYLSWWLQLGYKHQQTILPACLPRSDKASVTELCFLRNIAGGYAKAGCARLRGLHRYATWRQLCGVPLGGDYGYGRPPFCTKSLRGGACSQKVKSNCGRHDGCGTSVAEHPRRQGSQ